MKAFEQVKTDHKPSEQAPPEAVAIIGIACMFPKARDLESYWANIREGVDAITDIPATHWNPADYYHNDPGMPDMTYARRGGFLEAVDFNPMEFGISPRDIEATDTTQLLGLMLAKRALEDAGYGTSGRTYDRTRVSVILGVTGTLELVIPLGARLGHPLWRKALKEAGVDAETSEDVVQRISDGYVNWQENSFPGLLGNVAAGRIANRLDLQGTNCVVDAACASSLSALHLAVLELQAGRADMVLSGGLDSFNDIFMYMCFSKTPALSPTGKARPFDQAGDGTILGEGAGILVLKRLDAAERDGDRIYAVLRGIGSSSDGKGDAVYAPSAAGQARALNTAYKMAGVSPSQIELVEAHGTGTKVGDTMELKGLASVYNAAGRGRENWCALGSVKSMIGHTKAAAGAAGVIKAAMALHHKVLPPTLHVERPIEAAAPFYINTVKRPWLPRDTQPLRAGVSAFGFGGSNFHCVLEEYSDRKPGIDWDGRVQILAFSGDDRQEIVEKLRQFNLDADWETFRHDLAARSRTRFDFKHAQRLLIVAERDEPRHSVRMQIHSALEILEKKCETANRPASRGIYFGSGPASGKLAGLFPGQGSQYTGMLRDLACCFPQMQTVLADAGKGGDDEIFRLSDRIYPTPAFDAQTREAQESALRATDTAQPAIGAVSLGTLRVLEHFGVHLDAAAGHSFGELTALCAAGCLAAGDFHRLARLRGQFMAEGEEDRGAMLAIAADRDSVEAFISEHRLDLVIANRNAPRQIVLSGRSDEIVRAEALWNKTGCKRLNVAAAFHSKLVAQAGEHFAEALARTDFQEARFPVYANTTATPYPQQAGAARALLAGQLAAPVEFQGCVENLYAAGVRSFVEIGPGCGLSSLAKATLKGRGVLSAAVDVSGGRRNGLADLARTLAALAAQGHEITLTRWDEGELFKQHKQSGKPAMTVPLCGANYVAPKPKRPPRQKKQKTENKSAAAKMPCAMNAAESKAAPPPAQKTEKNLSEEMIVKTDTPSGPSAFSEALRATEESLNALVRMQEQTADLHRRFLDGQEKAMHGYQQLAERQQSLFTALLGQDFSPSAGLTTPSPQPQAFRPESAPRRGSSRAEARTPDGSRAEARTPDGSRAEARTPDSSLETELPASPAPDTTANDRPASERTVEALLAVVAEKTGYPVEMLELSMSLDTDLGIDSIKRVEIFSALQEQLPQAPAVKPEHMGELQTLGEVAGFLARKPGLAAAEPQSDLRGNGNFSPATSSANTQAPLAKENNADEGQKGQSGGMNTNRIADTLLAVVAEKTGYPVDMLELSMALDADLGIDSIKRVEILSALQEQLPEAPVVKPEHLGVIQTLGQIVEFMTASNKEEKHAAEAEKISVPVKAEIVEFMTDSNREKEHAAEAEKIFVPVKAKKTEKKVLRYAVKRREMAKTDETAANILPAGAYILVTQTDDGLSEALTAKLCASGFSAEQVAADTNLLPEKIAGLVLVAPSEGDHFVQHGFALARSLGSALRQAAQEGGALLATISRLDGSFGFGGSGELTETGVISGGLAGLAKTARHEWPGVHCKAIDLDAAITDSDWAAEQIAEQMLKKIPVEIGIDAEHCWTLALEEAPLARIEKPRFTADDFIIITGGARGVTAEAAVALAQSGSGIKLALLGRSPAPAAEPEWLYGITEEAAIKRAILAREPEKLSPRDLETEYQRHLNNREIQRNIARMETAGAQVLYRAVNVTDSASVAETIRELEIHFSPITGLIHGAGVLADSSIEDKTDFARVYDTKVIGLQNLLAALAHAPLKYLALFSSSTARFGRQGQADYAMANETLNKIAQQQARRRPNCRVVSINWGPWDGGMVTPALKRIFSEEGIEVIGLEAGADYLLDELAAENGPTETLILGAGSCLPADIHFQPRTEKNVPDVPPSFSPKEKLSSAGAGKIPLDEVYRRPIDLDSHPVLRSHILDGKPVLPLAIIVEWLAHGALHGNPGLRFCGFNDLRLFKGVILSDDKAFTLKVGVGKAEKHGKQFTVAAELYSENKLHARAQILLANRMPEAEKNGANISLLSYPYSREEIYTRLLFHGPELQGIKSVEGVSEAGIMALANTAPATAGEWLKNPPRQRWIADPLALDCSFQLMILWSLAELQSPSLPVLAGGYRQYRNAFPRDGVRIEARITEHNASRAVADIDWLDRKGTLVARMRGYECVIDASLVNAFRHNRLKI